ncbi:MAG TPA: hypothetical protein VMG36_02055 [Thermoplasmata archaeon]|nr:hypothetical protein [Thermoplasmata archaeon]
MSALGTFTGRLIVPAFVAACVLAALVFVFGSLLTFLYPDLVAAAITFLVAFVLIVAVGWVMGWGEPPT